ncbi:MAG: bifunctional phosphoribosyl-AMP cyclohydrolase/phosphoribosyl-ATP diphosphatase HisIE [Candidatus Aminicenantales bacterium]
MVIPSIDLSAGKAVQLRQGKDKVLERDDPFALARDFSRFGVIAVIDLDAAMGKGDNEVLVGGLCRLAECRVGGGIRSVAKALRLVRSGASAIIVGSKAFEGNRVNRAFLEELAGAIGRERVIVALDNVLGRVVVDGWRTDTGLDAGAVIGEIEPYASEILFTRVEREGMMGGTDLDAVRNIIAASKLPVTAAGGISSLDEIGRLSRLGASVQLGMALYTDAIKLSDAFAATLDWDKCGGLVPTIVQDESSRVLMLAWSDRESLGRTFETGRAWFHSRSRARLWMKGETSGNVQEFVRVRTDCDADSLLLTVRPKGPACHTGRFSCYQDKAFTFDDLYGVIRDRLENPPPGSYTATLDGEKLAAKVLEEAGELVEARNIADVTWEAADLVYFTWVLMARNGIAPADVLAELGRRRRSPRRGE